MKNGSITLASVALIALGACTAGPGHWNSRSFDTQSAPVTSSTGYGSATANNIAIHTNARGYRIGLTQKFASEVQSTVTFAFNSATLSPQAQQILARQASWMRQFPELQFRVYGYTDLVGTASYNQRLGLRRAQAVVRFLRSQGVGSARLEAVVSRGETQPLVVTPGPEQRNRRAVTEVLGFTANGGEGMGLNGEYARLVARQYVESGRGSEDGGGPSSTSALPNPGS